MCKQYLYLVSAVLVLCLVKCAPPNGIKICKSEDSKCIRESARSFQPIFVAGIPEYGVEILDPLKIKSMNASEGNLLFTLNDVIVKGLKNCDIKKLSRDDAKSQMSMKMKCTATLDGNYELNGSLLLLPIEGSGKIHVDLNSALFSILVDIAEKIGEDGKKHWSVKSYQHTFDLLEKSNVVFENLFNGNAVLGQAVEEVIKNNGNDVIKEIGSPVIKYVMGRVVKNFNRMFKAVPTEDLSIN